MDTNQAEDFVLLMRLRNDEEQAFDQLFHKYYPGLLKFCKAMLHYAAEEAEDLVQDVFFKLWQNRKTIEVQKALNAFLYQSVKYKVLDHFRRQKIQVYVPVDSVGERPADDYQLPDQLLMYKELHLDVDLLISRLPERTELVFRMNRHDALSYEDIAQMLGISIHSVKTHMYRAIKFLKESFRQYNLPS